MTLQTTVTGILMDDNTTVSLVEVSELCGISKDLLHEMIEHGLLDNEASNSKMTHINQRTLSRIQSAQRLQDDLDINLPGVVLVLELLDALEHARDELMILRHHVGRE